MGRRFAIVLGLVSVLGVVPLWADVTIRGRTVTTEVPAQIGDAQLGQAAGALAAALGNLGGLTDFLKAAGPQQPTTTTEEFVIYIKDGRMRMDSGPRSMILDPGRNGSAPVMLMLDHTQKRAMSMPLATAGPAEAITQTAASSGTVKALGETRTIMGHQARGYSFAIAIESGMFATPAAQGGGAAATPQVTNEGTAWLAPDIAGVDEVRAFYQGFAGAMRRLGSAFATAGLTAHMAALVEHGLPLETTHTTKASIETGRGSMPLTTSTATSTVTAVSTGAVTVSFSSAYELPCDCSCAAYTQYRELESRAKKSDAAARADLEARSACARQCLTPWTACARR